MTTPDPASSTSADVEAVREVIRLHRVKSGGDGSLVTYRCTGCPFEYVRDLAAKEPGIDWMADHVSEQIAVTLGGTP